MVTVEGHIVICKHVHDLPVCSSKNQREIWRSENQNETDFDSGE